jgi:hypothetical protein
VTFFIDGGGIFHDESLPDGVRLRINFNGDPSTAVSLFVDGNRLHAIGQYGRVIAERVAPNHVELFTIVPGESA